MADRERPWSKFYWSDWESDLALRQCSLSAQGLWMRMLCICAKADPRGYLTINGVTLNVAAVATHVSRPETEIAPLMAELERWGVFSRDRKGRIYSRRMLRDEKKSNAGRKAKNQALYGGLQPTENNGELSTPSRSPTRGASPQKPETRYQNKSSPFNAGEAGDAGPVAPAIVPKFQTDHEFPEFWHRYPNRTKQEAARHAWHTARQSATVAEIMAGLERYVRLLHGADPPHPANPDTWLSDKRWTDEPMERSHGRTQPASRPSPGSRAGTEQEHRAAIAAAAAQRLGDCGPLADRH